MKANERQSVQQPWSRHLQEHLPRLWWPTSPSTFSAFSFSHFPHKIPHFSYFFIQHLPDILGQVLTFFAFFQYNINLFFFQPDCCQFQMCHSWPQLLFISVGKRKVMEKWKTFQKCFSPSSCRGSKFTSFCFSFFNGKEKEAAPTPYQSTTP